MFYNFSALTALSGHCEDIWPVKKDSHGSVEGFPYSARPFGGLALSTVKHVWRVILLCFIEFICFYNGMIFNKLMGIVGYDVLISSVSTVCVG